MHNEPLARGWPNLSAGLGEAAERVECGVESPLTAPVRLVVGLGGHVSDQFVQLVIAGHQDGTVAVVSTGPKDQPFAVRVEQPQIA